MDIGFVPWVENGENAFWKVNAYKIIKMGKFICLRMLLIWALMERCI